MTDAQSKKDMQSKYKEREIVGGVYAIRNTLNDKTFIDAATDMRGSKNRFDFAQKTGSCIHMKLQDDWNRQGGGQFVFEVLEELRKGDGQTAEEFKADVGFLKDVWLDKLSDRELYS
jgi:hypothetical protein